MTIETLKAKEKLAATVESEQPLPETKRLKVSVDFRPKQAYIPILLIALGVLGLVAQFELVDSRILNYWWLIFLIVPLMQGRPLGCHIKPSHKK